VTHPPKKINWEIIFPTQGIPALVPPAGTAFAPWLSSFCDWVQLQGFCDWNGEGPNARVMHGSRWSFFFEHPQEIKREGETQGFTLW